MKNDIIKFLLGEKSFKWIWFGEKYPTEQGAFWWRKHLRQFINKNHYCEKCSKDLTEEHIVSTHLEGKYGFECKVDYDKDFATDEYYSLKIATYKKKIVGNLEIHITDSFKFVEAPDTYKYQSTIVEIVQGTEFQEIKIDKMWQLLMLIDMLQGVQRNSS